MNDFDIGDTVALGGKSYGVQRMDHTGCGGCAGRGLEGGTIISKLCSELPPCWAEAQRSGVPVVFVEIQKIMVVLPEAIERINIKGTVTV